MCTYTEIGTCIYVHTHKHTQKDDYSLGQNIHLFHFMETRFTREDIRGKKQKSQKDAGTWRRVRAVSLLISVSNHFAFAF